MCIRLLLVFLCPIPFSYICEIDVWLSFGFYYFISKVSLSSLGQVPSRYSLWDLSFSVFLESVMKTIQAGLSIVPSMVHWEGWTFPISLWQSRFLLQFISLFSHAGVKKFNVWSPTAVGQSFCCFQILGTNICKILLQKMNDHLLEKFKRTF